MHNAVKVILAALIGGAAIGVGYYLVDSEKLTSRRNGKILGFIPQADSDRYHAHDVGVGVLLFAFGAIGAGAVAYLASAAGVSTVAEAAKAATPAVSPVK